MKQDIATIQDVQLMVDTFYEKVQQDQLLGPIFESRIQGQWPKHLERMYRFWSTILLGAQTYSGTPFAPHATMPLEQHHFDRWLDLFNDTVDSFFAGPVADEAKWRANKMAELFHFKIQYFKTSGNTPLA